jgi:hypothetical protein
MNVIIGFSYPKKFKVGAYLISWWLSKPYSHTYIRFESSRLPSNVYHAANGMVHFRSYDNFLKNNIIIDEYKIPCDEKTRLAVLNECIQLSGEKYGHCELLKILISDFLHFFIKKDISFKNSKGYICSELVGRILVNQFKFTFNKTLFLLKPNDIEDTLNGKN